MSIRSKEKQSKKIMQIKFNSNKLGLASLERQNKLKIRNLMNSSIQLRTLISRKNSKDKFSLNNS